jgi:hypothetical protein
LKPNTKMAEETDPYEDLERELNSGDEHAAKLVHHLIRMGAESAMIPIEVDGHEYMVTVEYHGKKPVNDTP